ncbi:MAG: hypothetical protein GY755_17005 [Chloroflexi bacterium]|nr:hypothetical protein [Chloroflexota bacterium]
MKKTLPFLLAIILFITACQAQSAPAPTSIPAPAATPTKIPPETPTEIPTEVPLPTATLAPTETPLPEPTALPTETLLPTIAAAPDLFGAVKMEDAPMGFSLDPIAEHIFEAELQKLVDSGQIKGFQIERFGIYPRGDGTFFAEIYYALQADASFWPEDFGTLGDDGWTRGKCTLFDFLTTEEAFQLKNKKVCS